MPAAGIRAKIFFKSVSFSCVSSSEPRRKGLNYTGGVAKKPVKSDVFGGFYLVVR
jgi:hypothetical protein